MRIGRTLHLILATVSIASCGTRKETPEYFEAVTGIPICQSSKVSNRRLAEEADAGRGVVYSVRLHMDEACRRDFLKRVAKFQLQADPMANYEPSLRAQWISVTDDGDDMIVVYTS
jgi:hypothetical protein